MSDPRGEQSLDDYLDDLVAVLKETFRVLTPTGTLVLNIGYTSVPGRGLTFPIGHLLLPRLPFFLVQELIWHVEAGGGVYRRRFAIRSDRLYWLTKSPTEWVFNADAVRDPNVRYPNQWVKTADGGRRNRCNPNGKMASDVWSIPKVTSGRGRAAAERQPFPAQMPIALAERAILAFSHPGDVIADWYGGSGTTAVTALRHGRQALHLELRQDYIDLATARLSAEHGLAPRTAAMQEGVPGLESRAYRALPGR